jgi:HEAT repeat protein
MGPLPSLLLTLGLMTGVGQVPEPPAQDLARLREMLHDRLHPRLQSQAALLLLQDETPDAQNLFRTELRQTNDSEVFAALTTALRLNHDRHFTEELMTKLAGGQPAIRQASAEAIAELADIALVRRLQALVEDDRTDSALRQIALWALGHSGQKGAVVVLLDQLSNPDEGLRQSAADALSELTGLAYGLNVAGWRGWWKQHQDMTNERWLEERLAYKISQARRFEGELERTKSQVVSLHQQLYSRLAAADRLGHVATLADSDDANVRALAVNWCAELWPAADGSGQRAAADVLLRLSHDGSLEVERTAVLALGRIGDLRAADRLRHLLERGPASVRAAAARALAQQARGSSADALARQRQVVPALQKALEDPALEVVAEAAESLGTLGIPEAGPVLVSLLRHPSAAVRQTAALGLERVADGSILDPLIEALNDPIVTVRFSLVGALGRAAADGRLLTDAQRRRLFDRLEDLLVRDADPGVRSRIATVLGECGTAAQLPTLWRRVQTTEEGRVQEKAWSGFIEIMARTGNRELFLEWERTLSQSNQASRRIQLLTELATRWQQHEETRASGAGIQELLVRAHLEQGKWLPAFAALHEMLGRPTNEPDLDQRLSWLREIAELALKDGNRPDVLRAVQDARPLLARRSDRASVFDDLEKQAKQLH